MHLDLWHSGKSPAHISGGGGGGSHGSSTRGKIATRAGAGSAAGGNIMPMPLEGGDYEFDRWGAELQAFSDSSSAKGSGLRGSSSSSTSSSSAGSKRSDASVADRDLRGVPQ